jgi:hypothetical protein
VERYGVVGESGETCVELYLRKVQFIPVPMSSFRCTETKTLLISRTATVKELTSKVLRILNQILYKNGNKSVISKARLWAYTADNQPEIKDLEKRQKNFASIEVAGLRID